MYWFFSVKIKEKYAESKYFIDICEKLLLGSLIALINPKLLFVGVFMVLGAILSVVVTILHTILWRCKECCRWFGKGLSNKFCPYCGAKVDSESEE